jgi:ubiquinone biosynthesis protein UbiJ
MEERRALMTEAVEALPVDTVVELLKASGDSNEQNISHFMVRMLRKLAGQAKVSGDAGGQGDAELRDAAREIVDNWTLEDPNPLEHTRLLDQLSHLEEQIERFEQRIEELNGPFAEAVEAVSEVPGQSPPGSW